MYMWPNEIKEIVAEVLHAKNPITCFKKHINFPSAKNIPVVDTFYHKINYLSLTTILTHRKSL